MHSRGGNNGVFLRKVAHQGVVRLRTLVSHSGIPDISVTLGSAEPLLLDSDRGE